MAQKKDLEFLFKNNFKLIALDVDGTLINSDHILTSRTLRAIKNVKDTGIKITIATGRHYLSAIRMARKIQINAPLICSDGAIIKDIHSNNTIYHLLPREIAVDVMKMAQEYNNFNIQVFTKNGKIYAGPSYRRTYFKRFLSVPLKHSLRGYYNLMRDFVFIPVKNTGNIEGTIEALDDAPAKVVIHGSERTEDLKDFTNKIVSKYGNKISITSAIENCIDILNGGISKAKGLSILSDKLGIKREEIVTVGDNINDMEMLEYAGLGVAMGNAPDQVKSKADYVTASNNDDGLAKFLEKLLVQIKTEKFHVSQTKLCQSERCESASTNPKYKSAEL
ncbi:MAG: Cof-type HAD-IIB family hydrolase [Tepidanaerobacteraceae bacterium]|nr:Cof-type HAD-IIB family hydrolase [Tepidanaerobacteraceae bacterium]